MDGTRRVPEGRSRRTWKVRTRVLVLMLSVILLGLVLAGTVTFAIQFAQLNQRVDDELIQEVEELEQIAVAGPNDDRRSYTDLTALFNAFLLHSLPGRHESMITVIGDGLALKPGGEQPFDLDQPVVMQTVDAVYEEGQSTFTDLELDGKTLRLVVASVRLTDDAPRAALVVGVDVGAQRQQIYESMRTYGLVTLGTTALAAITGYAASGRLLRPLAQLREATSSIDAQDLTRRVEVEATDTDIAELTVTFNQMLDRLETGFLHQRQFLDDAAHELRTPITIIRGNLELMTPGDETDVKQTRELVLDEADRMQRLVDDLLLLARAQRPDFLRLETIEVASLADEIKDRVHLIGDRRWSGSAEGLRGRIQADRQRVLQAVVQLAANAVQFTEPSDRITVALTMQPASPEVRRRVGEAVAHRYLVISVEDTGVGIEADQLDRIFERFGRAESEKAVEGSGLGLAIVAAIARAHNGAVTVESEVHVGSVFRLWLPADRM